MAQDRQLAVVIGAGPAGLMAAEELARAGLRVILAEARPSPARKFLMAGKSGLNVTKDEPPDRFASHYDCPDLLRPMLDAFGPVEVQLWCRELGQEVFTGTSGRVFPIAIKASPLLRAWLRRLEGLGAELRTRWRWTGFEGGGLAFDTPQGREVLHPCVTVLALGGASWSRLGSDGAWVLILQAAGVTVAPWKPANMGLAVAWSPYMARHFGAPVKGAALLAGSQRERGEFVVSARGLEGGGIYAVARAVREGADLRVDLMPDLAPAEVEARLARMKPGETLANRLRKLGLSAVAAALVMEWGKGQPLAEAIKRLTLRHAGPRPLDEAISVAGGVAWDSVTGGLELRARPGVFVAGEMLDWEAPTGGYLLTACLATGRWAGRAAAGAAADPE
ncbi:MAG: TIGR03862 family flavoprotein [Paracoccaceae bacterium]